MNLQVQMKRGLRFIRYSRGLTLGVTLLVVILVFGFVISWFSPFDPRRWNTTPRDTPPTLQYFFGTTTLGQDVFWLTMHALRNSMILGFIASLLGLAVGATLGLIAGYKGGLIEKALLILGDVFVVIPALPILIVLSSMVERSLDMFTLGSIVAFLTWGYPVRNVRSMILSLREREFTSTAHFSNMSTAQILRHEYLPHILPWMLASFMGRTLMAIGMEATLAIFGLASLTEATLGTILYWALQYQAFMRGLWWWIAAPILIMIVLFLALYLISTNIVEYLDPRSRILRRDVRAQV